MRLSCNTFHAQVQSQILDLLHSNMVQLDCKFNCICICWDKMQWYGNGTENN